MKINNINNINPNFINTYGGKQKPSYSSMSSNSVQTSIYNQKGLTLPFGARFKPLNICEENCVGMLKKIKDGTRQIFLQNDVNEIMTSLRQEKDPKLMESYLNNLLDALRGTECDKQSFKRIVKLTAGKSEDEQFVILGFAGHELEFANQPLKAFCDLSAEKREKLMPFLEKISYADSSQETTEALYDTFRTLVYAEEDMSKLSGSALDKYKVDTCGILKDNVEYFRNVKDNEAASIAKNIYYYFVDNMV